MSVTMLVVASLLYVNGSQGSDRRGQGTSILIYRKSSNWLEYIKFRSAVFTHESSVMYTIEFVDLFNILL